jgi:hypothetical protein
MIEFTNRDLGKLRNAQAQLVEEVGVAKVMEITNKSKSVVYRWKDDKASDVMSLPEVMQVEGYLRRPTVSKEMILFLGCEIVGTPHAAAESNLSLHVAELVEHASRLVVETARAKADGIVTPAEAARLLDLLFSLERLIPAIKDTLIGVKVDGPLKVVVGQG